METLTWRIAAELESLCEEEAKRFMFERAGAIRAQTATIPEEQRAPCSVYFAGIAKPDPARRCYRTRLYRLNQMRSDPWPPMIWLQENFPESEGFNMDNVFVESLIKGDNCDRRALLTKETEFFERLFTAAVAEGKLFVPKANSIVLGRLEQRRPRGPGHPPPAATTPVKSPVAASKSECIPPASQSPGKAAQGILHDVHPTHLDTQKPAAGFISPAPLKLASLTSPGVSTSPAAPPPPKVRRRDPPLSAPLSVASCAPSPAQPTTRNTDDSKIAGLLFPDESDDGGTKCHLPSSHAHFYDTIPATSQAPTAEPTSEDEPRLEDGGLIFTKIVPSVPSGPSSAVRSPAPPSNSEPLLRSFGTGPVQIGLAHFFKSQQSKTK